MRSVTFHILPSISWLIKLYVYGLYISNACHLLVCAILPIIPPNSVIFAPTRPTFHYLSLQKNPSHLKLNP